MANPYITPAQFFVYYDARAIQELSGDRNSPWGDAAKVQTVLDSVAGLLDSTLDGRVSPVPMAAETFPEFLRGFLADLAAKRMFGRRPNLPASLKDAWTNAEKWLADFRDGAVNIPGLARSGLPALRDSDFTDGRSRFDRVPFLGGAPSATGPSKGR